MFKPKAFWRACLTALGLTLLASGPGLAQEAPAPADASPPGLADWYHEPPAAGSGASAPPGPAEAPSPAPGTEAAGLPAVLDVRVSATPQRARLVVDIAGPTEFAIASLDAPNRIAVDLRASSLPVVPPNPVAGEGLVQSYTIAQPEPGRVRALLVLNGYAQVQQAYVLEPFENQPARLVVDVIPATEAEFTARVLADLAAAQSAQAGGTPVQPTAPGDTNTQAQTRPLVVIDPGHGGMDNGASTPNGVHEKDIVLAFAIKLEELLVATDRFDVALTRSDDTFLRLEERVGLARANKADLFISIHADSFQQPEIRGASIYTRDPTATDDLDRILAEQENKADLIAGADMPDMPSVVVDILVDLMERETRRQAYVAAQEIVGQLEPSVQLRRFPVRQADFLVLQAPDVPSILVELGFLSNAEDTANLTEGEWQTRTAEALARGIAAYFDRVAQERGTVVAGP